MSAQCLRNLAVSIDGPRALHDQLRGRQGSYERALRTWRMLREQGVGAYIGTTLGPANQHGLDTMYGRNYRGKPKRSK